MMGLEDDSDDDAMEEQRLLILMLIANRPAPPPPEPMRFEQPEGRVDGRTLAETEVKRRRRRNPSLGELPG
jgi:hypothetical protein